MGTPRDVRYFLVDSLGRQRLDVSTDEAAIKEARRRMEVFPHSLRGYEVKRVVKETREDLPLE